MKTEEAQTVALQALSWVVANSDLCGVFLGASGLDQASLSERASDPELLAAVVDFLLMDEAWVLEFSDTAGLTPGSLLQARQALPGGAEVNWT